MIKFDQTKLRVEYVKLKSITTALGGAVSVLDEKETIRTGKDKFTRIPVPMAVARLFIKDFGSKYLVPVLTALTYYDDVVVAIERQMFDVTKTTTLGGEKIERWISQSEKNITEFIPHVIEVNKDVEWFTDGTYLYNIKKDEEPQFLDTNGTFRNVLVNAVNMQHLSLRHLMFGVRSCIAFYIDGEQQVMSPPIWKNLDGVGTRQMQRTSDDEESGDVPDVPVEDVENDIDIGNGQFDRIDQFLMVNLAFALRASAELIDVYGYDSIEPLRLDDLMVQLCTVNLPNVPKQIKQTYEINLSFTHTVAWLLGLLSRTDNLNSYRVIRSLLKYLTSKGVYRKTAFKSVAIYKEGMSPEDIETKTLEEAANDSIDTNTNFTFLKEHKDGSVNVIGNLYTEEL